MSSDGAGEGGPGSPEALGIQAEKLLAVAERLEGVNYALPPILLTSSLIALVMVSPMRGGLGVELSGLLLSIAVMAALIGGALELLFLSLIEYAAWMAGERRGSMARRILAAGLLLGLYYLVLGILLIGARIRSIESSLSESEKCHRLYNPILFLATVGLALGVYQECASKNISSGLRSLGVPPLEQRPEGLGPQGD